MVGSPAATQISLQRERNHIFVSEAQERIGCFRRKKRSVRKYIKVAFEMEDASMRPARGMWGTE
jgi:hypothetical protein